MTSSVGRLFFVFLAVLILAIVGAGFWPTYFGPLLRGEVFSPKIDAAWFVHLHGITFLGWTTLLLAQTLLIAGGRTRSHQQIGQYGIGLGALVFVVGWILVVLFIQDAYTARPNYLAIWLQLVIFGPLLAAGYVYRTRPEAHKRFMIFATIALLPAPIFRMGYLLGEWPPDLVFGLLLAIILGYDLRTQGRIHPVSAIGTLAIIAYLVVTRVV